MYLSSEKPHPIDFDADNRDLMIDSGESISDEVSVSVAAAMPKKRAETWVQDETQTLISLRHETDSLFNTSKSNKHLWDQISAKMSDRGFDRSPTMCTDKWRNLLKEFKKAKHHHGRSVTEKMAYYKEIGDILGHRTKSSHSPEPAKLDSLIHFSDKGVVVDTSISFEQVEATCQRETMNLERCVDHDQNPPPWNSWRDTHGNCAGGNGQSYRGSGRFISVKWGDYTRRIGIEGTAESIKEAIKSAFRFRTRRAFWLEDEEQVVRSLDKNMPLGNYSLHIDEGLIIKVCLYDESEHMAMHAEEKIFYTEEDYRDFLTRQGWTCLREFDGYNVFCNMDDLRPGAIYRGSV